MTWILMKDGTFIISGTGDMVDFSDRSNTSWYNWYDYITTLLVNEGVTHIGDNAFYACGRLTDVIIPASVLSIGEYAFDACRNLAVHAAEGTYAYNYAIAHGFRRIILDGALGEHCTYSYCTDGTLKISGSGAMPDYTLASYGASPWFERINQIKSIVIEDGVTDIGDYMFMDCRSAVSVTIPKSVKHIGEGAFGNCIALSDITLPDNLESISSHAFYGCKAISFLKIPSGVKRIEILTFHGCSSLLLSIPESVEYISDDAFVDCGENLILRVVKGSYAQSYAQSKAIAYELITGLGKYSEDIEWLLRDGTLTVSGSGEMTNYLYAEDVPWFAFSNRIKNIVIGSGVTNIEDEVFDSCLALSDIEVDEENTAYCDIDGVLFTKDKKIFSFIRAPRRLRRICVPSAWKVLQTTLFANATLLQM